MEARVHGYPRHYHREARLHIGAVRSVTTLPSPFVSLRCFRPGVHQPNPISLQPVGPKAGAGSKTGPATDHDDALTQARGGVPPPPVELLPRGAERGEWREEHTCTCMLCVLPSWCENIRCRRRCGGDSEGVCGGCRWEVRSPSCVQRQSVQSCSPHTTNTTPSHTPPFSPPLLPSHSILRPPLP